MDQKLFEKQQEDWEQYLKESARALEKLIDDEWQMRKDYGINDQDLSPEMLEKIQEDRAAWVKEWGTEGSRVHDLKQRHRQEFNGDIVKEQAKQSLWD